jgi:hypothetical protein
MATLRDDIADIEARLDDPEDTARDREKYLRLVLGFMRCLLELHLELVDEVERELSPRRPDSGSDSLMRLYSRAAVEPELAHINRRAGPRRLGGVHRPECLVALAHVLDGVEELNRDGRSLRLVEQQLYSGCRHAGRGPPASSTRATSSCTRSAVTSVNRTTRTYMSALLRLGVDLGLVTGVPACPLATVGQARTRQYSGWDGCSGRAGSGSCLSLRNKARVLE